MEANWLVQVEKRLEVAGTGHVVRTRRRAPCPRPRVRQRGAHYTKCDALYRAIPEGIGGFF